MESLKDVLTASDTIIGLTTRFGSERLLLELIAQCNVHKQQIALYRNRIALVMAKLTLDSLTELELSRVPIQELRSACQGLKLLSQELLGSDESETIISPKEQLILNLIKQARAFDEKFWQEQREFELRWKKSDKKDSIKKTNPQ
jgi:hypothetical protein